MSQGYDFAGGDLVFRHQGPEEEIEHKVEDTQECEDHIGIPSVA